MNLFRSLFSNPRRDPHGWAEYLGNDQWRIKGSIYTGTVAVAGGGVPTVGQLYPGFCRDPDSWRNWAVIVPNKVRVKPSNIEPEPTVIVLQWISEQADFQRSQSQLGVSLNYDNLVETSSTPSPHYDRFSEDFRVAGSPAIGISIPSDYYTGRSTWNYNSPEADDALGIGDGSLQDYYDQMGEDYSYEEEESERYTITYTVGTDYSAYLLNHCIVGDSIFAEVEYYIDLEVSETYESWDGDDWVEDYSDSYSEPLDSVTLLVCLSATAGEAYPHSVQVRWIFNESDYGISGRLPISDVVVTGGRVMLLLDGEEIYHLSAETGGDVQSVDMSDVWEAGDNDLDVLIDCIGNDWLCTYARGDDGRVWLGNNQMPLTCVNLATNSVEWFRNSDVDGTRQYPIGWANGALITACEHHLMETITNRALGLTYDEYYYDIEVKQRQGGMSLIAGLAAVNPSTGAEIAFAAFPGQEEDGERRDPFEDYQTAGFSLSWSTFPNRVRENGDPIPDTICASQVYLIPPDITDFFNGYLYDAGMDTSITGTYAESGGIPNQYGDFHGVEQWLTHGGPVPGGYEGYTEITDAIDARINGIKDERNWSDPEDESENPPQTSGFRKMFSDIETRRQGDEDYIRASALRFSTSQPLLLQNYEESTQFVGSDYFSWTDVKLSTIERLGLTAKLPNPVIRARVRESGYDYASSYNWQGVGANKDYPEPYEAFQIMGHSDQFRAWQNSRTSATSPPDPWPGMWGGRVMGGVNGGHQTFSDERLIWRSYSTTPRYRTPTPRVTLGPSCSTGDALIVGPRYVLGENMVWRAFANGEWLWSAEHERESGYPGPPLAIGIPNDGVGIWTGYQYSGDYYLCVLDAEDGSILYDEETSQSMLQMLFGDGTLWKISANFGLTN